MILKLQLGQAGILSRVRWFNWFKPVEAGHSWLVILVCGWSKLVSGWIKLVKLEE